MRFRGGERSGDPEQPSGEIRTWYIVKKEFCHTAADGRGVFVDCCLVSGQARGIHEIEMKATSAGQRYPPLCGEPAGHFHVAEIFHRSTDDSDLKWIRRHKSAPHDARGRSPVNLLNSPELFR
jgi:hypothetical protein